MSPVSIVLLPLNWHPWTISNHYLESAISELHLLNVWQANPLLGFAGTTTRDVRF